MNADPTTTPAAGTLLREVTRLYVRAQRNAADCCGTSPTQAQVITELGRTGAVPMNELGKRLCLEKSWVSRAIDGLVEEGLVDKITNPADSRSWLVNLTAAGRTRLKALNAQIEAHAERVLQLIAVDQRARVNDALQAVLHALRVDAGLAEATACCPPTETKPAAARRAARTHV